WTGATFNHAGINSGCNQCHTPEFNATTNPNHVAMGFPTNCEACHNTTTWTGATFNHTGITSGCDRCHQTDYDTTTSPSHLAAGFPTTCQTCHNTNTWQGAVFNHTFNINSGPHRTFSCTECHQTPSSYSIVSCTHCHEHRQSNADGKHSGVSGYSWNSAACINCHLTGK
ncbi:MAG: cytochrome c3 family protein, partial [Planctomycetales bacterium]|nr:cytochrome c3 family protein [Planctomycetales bacterium]